MNLNLRDNIHDTLVNILNESNEFSNTVTLPNDEFIKFIAGFYDTNKSNTIVTGEDVTYDDKDKFTVNYNNNDMQRAETYFGIVANRDEPLWKYFPTHNELLTDMSNDDVWSIIKHRK